MRTLNHAFFDGRRVTKTYHNNEKILHLSMELGSDNIEVTYKPKIGLDGYVLINESIPSNNVARYFRELGADFAIRCIDNFKEVSAQFESGITAQEFLDTMEVSKRGYDITHYRLYSTPLLDKVNPTILDYIYVGGYKITSGVDIKHVHILGDYILIYNNKKQQIFTGMVWELKSYGLILGKMYGAIMDAVNNYIEFTTNCTKYDYQTAIEYIYDSVVGYIIAMQDGIYSDMDWYDYLKEMDECALEMVGDIEHYQNEFNNIMNRLVTEDVGRLGIEADLTWDSDKRFLWVDMGGEYV